MINSAKGNVIVVGSGLAGMSAAVNLVHANYKVLVIERSKHLGGRTSSWFQDDMVVESGLHRYLSLYYHLPRLLKTAGVSLRDIIKWQDKIAIRTAEKQPIELSISIIHKPIRTIISLFSHYDLINIKKRIKLLKMFRHMVYLYYKKPYYLDSLTVKDMADAFNIEQDTVDFVLKPFTEGIFFLPIERYSAYVLMGLILPYKWRLPFVRIGTFNGPMSEVLIKPLEDYITKRGGSVIKSTAVESLVTNNNKVVGISTNTGKEYFADAVILATSLGPAKKIIRMSELNQSYFSAMQSLPTMPAVTMQFKLTEPSLPSDITNFGPNTSMASFAEQSRSTFKNANGRLSVIMSEPSKYIKYSQEELARIIYKDAFKLGVNLSPKNVISYKKIVEQSDFYELGTNTEILRPVQVTKVRGLLLAGDYTKQRYLATMEGAVYSGMLATDYIINM